MGESGLTLAPACWRMQAVVTRPKIAADRRQNENRAYALGEVKQFRWRQPARTLAPNTVLSPRAARC